MRILHIAYSLGESSAATRLISAQAEIDDIKIFLGRVSKYKKINNLQVLKLIGSIIGNFFHILNKLINYFFLNEKKIIFSFYPIKIIQIFILKYLVKKYKIQAIHLHWGGFGFFPLSVIEYINLPIVITMHDFGYATGGCHVPLECSKYTENCRNCPIGKGKFIKESIETAARRTRKLLEKNMLAIVSPSNYVKEKIAEIIKNNSVYVIGNCYPSEYCDLKNEKNEQRMPTLITVGLDTNNQDNKGYSTIIKTFKLLKEQGIKFKYISVGHRYEFAEPKIREHYNFCEQTELIRLYQKSTLCLVPSKYETFSQVSLEAILCGTPVVAYDLTGPRDIISNLENGVLVTSFDEEEYAETVFGILNRDIKINFNNLNVKDKFKPTSIYNSHLEVYKSLSPQ